MSYKNSPKTDRSSLEGLRLSVVVASFLILYNISFTFNESLSTARITVVLLVLALLMVGWRSGPLDARLFLLFVPVPYTVVQLVLTLDSGQLSRFFHLALFSYLGAFGVAALCVGVDSMLKGLLIAISFQSVLLLLSFVSPEYRAWADAWIFVAANFDAGNIYRAPGFTSSSGSALSVIQSLGVLVGGMLLWSRVQRGRPASVLIMLLMILNLVSCIFVGRTGLILSIFYILVFCWQSKALRKLFWINAFVLVPCVLFIWSSIVAMLPSNFSEDFFLDWAFGFLRGDNYSVSDLSSMPIPPLGLETFLGTGLVGLIDGANPSGHDGGFVQAYYSLGLVMSALFYIAYTGALLVLLKWLPWTLRLGVAASFLLIEVKEPFVFKYSGMFVLVSIYFSARYDCETEAKHFERGAFALARG